MPPALKPPGAAAAPSALSSGAGEGFVVRLALTLTLTRTRTLTLILTRRDHIGSELRQLYVARAQRRRPVLDLVRVTVRVRAAHAKAELGF